MANINIGGSYSVGTTNGTSFTMGMPQTHKDFGVKKNTSGNEVTWTYKGTLPQFYVYETSDAYYYKHQTPADILVNDCDVTGQQWQYFRLEVSATQGNNRLNIGDIDY